MIKTLILESTRTVIRPQETDLFELQYTLNILKGKREDLEHIVSKVTNTKNVLPKISSKLDRDILKLEKMIRQFNDYKHITISKEYSIDCIEITITFPKGTTRKFKDKWLLRNNLPIKNVFHPASPIVTFSGNIAREYVEHKANVCTITKTYDLG